MKKKLALCKKVFGACKTYEDKSIAYIATCKTSTNALKTILKGLYQSLEKVNKVLYKNERIKNSTGSSRTARGAAKSYTTSVTLIQSITTFTTTSSSLEVDQIGTDDTLKELAKNIAITSITTMTFTTIQITTITAYSVTLTVIKVKIEVRIIEVNSMLNAMTGSTQDPTGIAIETLETDKAVEATTAMGQVPTPTPSPSPSPTPSPKPTPRIF